jgi:hypothetical protein
MAERITQLREREATCGRAGRVETSVMVNVAEPLEALPEFVARFYEIGVQRIVFGTPRPWHPAKLEAVASALGF